MVLVLDNMEIALTKGAKRSVGRPALAPSERCVRITVTLDPPTHAKLRALQAHTGKNASELLREALLEVWAFDS